MLGESCLERAQSANADEREELLPGVGEVLTQVVVDGDAFALELRLQDLRHERRAASASARGARVLLQRADRCAAGIDRGADRSLAHVVAGADLGSGWERRRAMRRGRIAPRREDQILWVLRQRQVIQHRLQPAAIVVGVADQNAAQET